MLSVIYKPFMLTVSYADCNLCWVSHIKALNADCLLCWVSNISPLCWISLRWVLLCRIAIYSNTHSSTTQYILWQSLLKRLFSRIYIIRNSIYHLKRGKIDKRWFEKDCRRRPKNLRMLEIFFDHFCLRHCLFLG